MGKERNSSSSVPTTKSAGIVRISLLQTFKCLRRKQMGPGELTVLKFIVGYLCGALVGGSVVYLKMKEKEKK